eukprot:11373001-Alexandrium_andersonii.AAC.1
MQQECHGGRHRVRLREPLPRRLSQVRPVERDEEDPEAPPEDAAVTVRARRPVGRCVCAVA